MLDIKRGVRNKRLFQETALTARGEDFCHLSAKVKNERGGSRRTIWKAVPGLHIAGQPVLFAIYWVSNQKISVPHLG